MHMTDVSLSYCHSVPWRTINFEASTKHIRTLWVISINKWPISTCAHACQIDNHQTWTIFAWINSRESGHSTFMKWKASRGELVTDWHRMPMMPINSPWKQFNFYSFQNCKLFFNCLRGFLIIHGSRDVWIWWSQPTLPLSVWCTPQDCFSSSFWAWFLYLDTEWFAVDIVLVCCWWLV